MSYQFPSSRGCSASVSSASASQSTQATPVNVSLTAGDSVLLDVATGLRQSELFGLKWKDVDFKNKQLLVILSIVQQVVGKCKTEASQKPVPLHDHLIRDLRNWRRQTPYQTPVSWVKP